MGSTRYPTRLDVIQAVREVAASDQETLATVADRINRGQVRRCGDAAGAGHCDVSLACVSPGRAGVRQAWRPCGWGNLPRPPRPHG
jgi:hypothetical protein